MEIRTEKLSSLISPPVYTNGSVKATSNESEQHVYADGQKISTAKVLKETNQEKEIKQNDSLWKYVYDEQGLLKELWRDDDLSCRYEYNNVNELVREDSLLTGQTVRYHYDGGGNLQKVVSYPLDMEKETEKLTDGMVESRYRYDQEFPDRLVSFQGNVIFGLLALFFIYNTVSLRGFYYARNDPMCFFGFMDHWQGHTTATNRSYGGREGMGYVPDPADIHDTKEATEWYGSIFGTIVFMKWKWIGLHVGDYMILVDTWVPIYFRGDNHILGHPYYILHRYNAVKKYPLEDEEGNDLYQIWEKELGKDAVTGEISRSEWLKNKNFWDDNVNKYRIITIIYYSAILLIVIAMIVRFIIKRKRKRKQLREMP